MHYVVLEVEATHRIEAPKDHGRVNKLSYQFIDAESMKAYYADDQIPLISLDQQGSISFQESIAKFDRDVMSIVGEDEFVLYTLLGIFALLYLARLVMKVSYFLHIYSIQGFSICGKNTIDGVLIIPKY